MINRNERPTTDNSNPRLIRTNVCGPNEFELTRIYCINYLIFTLIYSDNLQRGLQMSREEISLKDSNILQIQQELESSKVKKKTYFKHIGKCPHALNKYLTSFLIRKNPLHF